MRGGEGSFAGGGSFVTARSLAGDGEGGPERDMVGVGLNTPDTDGSGREACSHVKRCQEDQLLQDACQKEFEVCRHPRTRCGQSRALKE